MKDDAIVNIRITVGTLFAIGLVVLFGWLFYEIRDILLIIISAVIFSIALSPGKRFLARFRVPEPVAVMVLYIFVFLIFSFLVYSLVPILIQQYQLFLENLPKIVEIFRTITAGTIFEGLFSDQSIGGLIDANQFSQTTQSLITITGSSIFSVFGGLVNVMLFLLLTFLFAVNPRSLDNFLFVVTAPKYREYVQDLWHRTQAKLGRWFQGQVVLVAIIGALTYLPLVILGIPNALFLAFFAGMMELVPIFGPVLGAIPAVLMALTTGDITAVIGVIIVFVIIQLIENNLIYPLVVSKVVGISSVLIILSIVIGVSIAGFVGALIAVPLAGIIQEFFSDVKSGKFREMREVGN